MKPRKSRHWLSRKFTCFLVLLAMLFSMAGGAINPAPVYAANDTESDAATSLTIKAGTATSSNPTTVYTTLKTFSEEEMTAKATTQQMYSYFDSMPAPVKDAATGVPLADLLDEVGISLDNVERIYFYCTDITTGPYSNRTKAYLFDTPRYYFPLIGDSWDPDEYKPAASGTWGDDPTAGKVAVEPMLAVSDNWKRVLFAGEPDFNTQDTGTRFRLVNGQSESDYLNGTITASTSAKWINEIDVKLISAPVTGVTLDQSAITLAPGESEQLTATVTPAYASDHIVSWSSDNPSAATVDDSGLVTAVAGGNATITVTTTDGSFTATCAVTVEVEDPGLLTPPALTADTTDNTLGQAADITFPTDAAWEAAISGITVNGAPLTGGQYTISPGNINIAAGVFAEAGDYGITVQAAGYTDATVTQTMQEAAPTDGYFISEGRGNMLSISAGLRHNMALKNDRTVWTWGLNENGELGNSTTVNSCYPVQVVGLTDVKTIAAGRNHCVALKNDGTVWTWGQNKFGQLGNGTKENSSVPVQVVGLSDVKEISVKRNHVLALKNDGTVWAWGWNLFGQIGDGTTTSQTAPLQVAGLPGEVKHVAAGDTTSYVLAGDGTVWAWGGGFDGQLGNGQTPYSVSSPVQVTGLADVKYITSQSNTTMAIKSDGTAWVWGYNNRGWSFGTGTSGNSSVPIQISTITGVKLIQVGCALLEDGTVWTWGFNYHGALGNGSLGDEPLPVKISDPAGVKELSAGSYHMLALKDDGTVWGWGMNDRGQLGDENLENKLIPTQIKLAPPAVSSAPGAAPGSVELIFTDDAAWRESITAISVDGAALAAGKYTITEGKISFGPGIFDQVKEYSVCIKADGFLDAVVENASGIYNVTVDSSVTGGSLAVNPTIGNAGAIITVAVTPAEGKRLVAGSLKYTTDNGENYTEIAATDGVYSFGLPAANVTVTAQFEVIPSGDKTPPLLTADSSSNLMGQAVDITFTDDPDWRTAISGITVNGTTLTGEQYTVTAGNISIAAGVFTTADSYAIAVQAGGYDDATIAQTMFEDVTLTVRVDDDGNITTTVYRISELEQMEIGRTRVAYTAVDNLPACQFMAAEGILITDFLDLVNVSPGEVSSMKFISTDGYQANLRNQEAVQNFIYGPWYYYPKIQECWNYDDPDNPLPGAEEGKYQVPSMLALKSYMERFNGRPQWEHMDYAMSFRLCSGQATVTERSAGGLSKWVNEVDIVLLQQEEGTPPALSADSTNNNIGQPVNITFTDDEAWRTAISGITINGTPLTGEQYTATAGSINIAAGAFSAAGDHIIIVTATGYEDATVTQTMTTGGPQIPVSLSLSKSAASTGEWITASGTGPANTWISLRVLDADGNVVVFDAVKSDSQGNYSIEFGVPAAEGDALNVIVGFGTNIASATLGLKLDPPALTADTSNNVVGQSIDITFSPDTDWQAAISGITVNGNNLTSGQYTISDGNINITAGAFSAAGSYQITVTAAGYKDAQVTQTIAAKTPPALTADTINNVVGQSIDITFSPDADWQEAISGITVNGNNLSSGQYTISDGNINITAGAFSAAGSYQITVTAANYADATVNQEILGAAPGLTADITNNSPEQTIEITFTDNEAWRNAITGITVDEVSIAGKYTIAPGVITLDNTVFTETGSFSVAVKATGYADATVTQNILNPCYLITPEADQIYVISENQDGIKIMTVNPGVSGMKYFNVGVTPVRIHNGAETLVFVHKRDGLQLSLNTSRGDFDLIDGGGAGFNVSAGDIIKVYMVDQLTNAIDFNPTIFQ
jgi:alpha-tubulin suppressor-like RCC1 family protein